jgi:hypothetical protein
VNDDLRHAAWIPHLIGAISFDSRLGVAAATYLAGFILAAAWPPSFLPTIILAHLIGATSYLFVVSSRARRLET